MGLLWVRDFVISSWRYYEFVTRMSWFTHMMMTRRRWHGMSCPRLFSMSSWVYYEFVTRMSWFTHMMMSRRRWHGISCPCLFSMSSWVYYEFVSTLWVCDFIMSLWHDSLIWWWLVEDGMVLVAPPHLHMSSWLIYIWVCHSCFMIHMMMIRRRWHSVSCPCSFVHEFVTHIWAMTHLCVPWFV